MFAKDSERNNIQHREICRGEHHWSRDTVAVGAAPVHRGHAPSVTRHESWKRIFGPRRAEVVSDRSLVGEKFGRHDSADRVTADVLFSGAATSVAKESGQRVGSARLEFVTEYVAFGHAPSIASVAADSGDSDLFLEALVQEADEPGNKVLPDNSRSVRWAGRFFAFCALALIPWIIVIAITLPSREISRHYDVAWSGFDVLLFLALSATAFAALRRSRLLVMAASAAATLLVTDAWFDIMTAPNRGDLIEAVIMAVIIELPLGATCIWLAMHAEEINDRRLRLLMRQSARLRADRTTTNTTAK
jgi:hypothetical protein